MRSVGGVVLSLALAAPALAAQPPEATNSVVSYPAAFFEGQQVANASEMVARLPGFTMEEGDAVRGFEGAAGNVLVDGQRPTSKTDTLEETLRRIPASRVERIELIRGGAPGVDMQGKSVLANVVRKPGGGIRGLISLADVHTYDRRDFPGIRAELSGGAGKRNWELSARYAPGNDDGGDDGPLVRIGPNGEILRRTQVTSRSQGVDQILTGAYEQPLAGGTVRLNGRLYWEKWKFEEDDVPLIAPAGAPVETTDETDFTRDTELGAKFNRSFGPRTGLEALILQQTGRYQADQLFVSDGQSSEFQLLRHTTETIGRAVLTHGRSDSLSFEGGGEAALNVLRSRTGLFDDGAPVPLPAANVRVEEKRAEGFLKSSWRPAHGWTVDAALRYETSAITSSGDVGLSKSLSFVKPRLAVSWQASRATQLRLRYEKVVGQLDFDDFVAQAHFNTGSGVSAGNPDLNPEQAWVSEAALEQKLPGGVLAVLTLRRSELKDVVDRGPVAQVTTDPQTGAQTVVVFDQPTNIGSGRKDELAADLTVPSDPFGWKGGLLKAQGTWRWSRVTDPTTRVRREISNLKPLEWQVTYSQDLPRQHMSLGVDVFSGWRKTAYRFDAIESLRLHDAWVDVWVERKLRPDLTLRVELDNLAKRGIGRTLEAYPGPRSTTARLFTDRRELKEGRNVYVRLRKTFGS